MLMKLHGSKTNKFHRERELMDFQGDNSRHYSKFNEMGVERRLK